MTRIADPGPIPISFRLAYDASDIHSDDVYSIQAAIVDGSSAWATAGGSLVITKGNPTSDIPLTLTYRPDLLKGAVTGDLTGVGIAPSAGSYGVAILVDLDTGATQGIQYLPTVTSVPAPFSVPFNPTTIDKNRDYVIQGAIVDPSTRWENETGVPAITKGNPLSGLQVVLAEAATPIEPSPGDADASRASAIILILLLIVAMVVCAYLIRRSRTQPPGGAAAAAAVAGGTAAEADAMAASGSEELAGLVGSAPPGAAAAAAVGDGSAAGTEAAAGTGAAAATEAAAGTAAAATEAAAGTEAAASEAPAAAEATAAPPLPMPVPSLRPRVRLRLNPRPPDRRREAPDRGARRVPRSRHDGGGDGGQHRPGAASR